VAYSNVVTFTLNQIGLDFFSPGCSIDTVPPHKPWQSLRYIWVSKLHYFAMSTSLSFYKALGYH